MFAQQSHSTAA